MGFPIGLATLADEVGLDVASHIADYLGDAFKGRFGDTTAMVSLLKEMGAKGFHGKFSLCYSSISLCYSSIYTGILCNHNYLEFMW